MWLQTLPLGDDKSSGFRTGRCLYWFVHGMFVSGSFAGMKAGPELDASHAHLTNFSKHLQQH